MIGSFTGLSTENIETRSDKRPPIRSCIHYQILWLSRFASMQHDLDPLKEILLEELVLKLLQALLHAESPALLFY